MRVIKNQIRHQMRGSDVQALPIPARRWRLAVGGSNNGSHDFGFHRQTGTHPFCIMAGLGALHETTTGDPDAFSLGRQAARTARAKETKP